MAHEEQSEIGRKIWESEYWGPEGAVELGRRQYEQSRRMYADRIVWMSTVFSALGDARQYLRSMEWEWIRRAGYVFWKWQEQVRHFHKVVHAVGFADDQAETVSRNLFAYSKLPLLGGVKFRRSAAAFARYANELAKRNKRHDTAALAANTLAEVAFIEDDNGRGEDLLREAASLAHSATDPNQKSRIFRQLAELWYRYPKDTETARDWMDLAEGVRDIGEDVRKKNAAMRRRLGL
jgi:hypothetical protein